jgi:hypothetical protein
MADVTKTTAQAAVPSKDHRAARDKHKPLTRLPGCCIRPNLLDRHAGIGHLIAPTTTGSAIYPSILTADGCRRALPSAAASEVPAAPQ